MDKNTQRDERILAHMGLYRITFRRVLSLVFFDGASPGNVLQRLVKEGRVQSRGGLPNRLRYYQLTPTEATRRGLPVARSRPPKPQAFQTHLGILWHCCLTGDGQVRRRLEQDELLKLFREHPPQGFHILEAGRSPRVLRVHIAGPQTPARVLVRFIRKRVERLRRLPELGTWIRNNQYALLILTDSEPKRARIMELLQRHGTPNRASIVVGFGPSLQTAGRALAPPKLRPRSPGERARGAG